MGRIKVHEFITLDGVVDDPSWSAGFGFPDELGAAVDGIVAGCTSILLGRTTYEMFSEGWRERTAEEDPGAPFFNGAPKHVVSASIAASGRTPDWGPVSVVDGYDADAVRALRDAGDVYVGGSATLVRALLADDLVDELHLFVYPLALGAGLRLFGQGGPPVRLATRSVDAFTNGVVHVVYGPSAGGSA